MRQTVQEDIGTEAGDEQLLPYLSAYIRQSQTADGRPIEVGDDWRDHARAHADSTIPERVRRLLEFIGQRSRVGEAVELVEDELPPWINAATSSEVRFLLAYLESQRYITLHLTSRPAQERRNSGGGDVATVKLTVAGWEAISPVAGAGIVGTCFVAMSFDPALDDAFSSGIYAALKSDCGFTVNRVDRTPHNDNITDHILAGIRASQFVVADFTGHRQGVYFEAGFAQGLGRTVIRTCRDTDFNQLHFDTRQFFHLKWSTPADLRVRLADHVLATIGRWSVRS